MNMTHIKIWLNKVWKKILQHKIISIFLAVAILGGGYYVFGKFAGGATAAQYVFSTVEKGTLVVSVSGSGQVSALNQVDVKTKTSGDITYIGVKAGQYISAETLIAQVDARDAKKAVRDAETNLETAQLSYDQAAGSINGIRGAKEKNQETLDEAYDNGFSAVTNAFADLPTVIAGLNSILTSYDYDSSQRNLYYYADAIRLYYQDISIVCDETYAKYLAVRKAYDQNFINYKSVSRFSDKTQIEAIINQTYETSRLVAEAIKSASNLIQVYKDKTAEAGRQPKTLADTHLSNLNGYVSKANSHVQSLSSAKNNIQSGKEAVIGTDFDIRTEEIQLNKAKDALLTAQEELAGCYVYAPFSGIVAKVNVKISDSSSGSAVATLITQQKIAEISLNEVDVAKVKAGQKVTLTFDAISDLTITGEVSEVDAIGTASQGVINYGVKITFDAQDDRVKSSMSTSAAIITETKQDVLLVPNAAVKSQGDTYFVEISGMTATAAPVRQSVEIGISNDTMTEITNGLKEGDSIISRTINSTATAQTQSGSSFGIPGVTGGGSFGR